MSQFARAPFIVIWETTRACALACVHCRAEAIPRRDPDELTATWAISARAVFCPFRRAT